MKEKNEDTVVLMAQTGVEAAEIVKGPVNKTIRRPSMVVPVSPSRIQTCSATTQAIIKHPIKEGIMLLLAMLYLGLIFGGK